MKQTSPIVAFLALALAACGGESEPPTISNLTFDPAEVSAGTQVTINGTVDFSDPEGDLEEGVIEVVTPAGAAQTLELDVVGAGGMTQGTIAIQIRLIASEVGTYGFELFLIDAEGNESNRMPGAVESVE